MTEKNNMKKFTQKEWYTLEDCVLQQIDNSGKAINVTISSKIADELKEEINFLQKLYAKLCSMEEEMI